MSLKTFLSKLWTSIGSVFQHAEEEVRVVLLPAVTQIVNGIKTVVDLDQADLIGGLAGGLGPAFEEKLRDILPKILTELKLIDAVVNAGDVNAQVLAALDALNLSSDRTKSAFYHDIAAMLLQDLADGKLSWSEAVTLVEYYYHNAPKP
jgi:hypothetical protein